ncbi:MAG: hypothetical protein HN348_26995 [Proteobacteria bacterium]|nr:hypothetical protein [Pseudomonadota bacterium]
MKFKGTLRHVDLGPGQWVLETDDGRKMPLYGDVPDNLAGKRVRVTGDEVQAMGFAMTGGSAGIEVHKIKAS